MPIIEHELVGTMQNLKNFRTQINFQKAVFAYIASQHMNNGDEIEYRELFKKLDKDEDGLISKDELIAALQSLGVKSQEAQKEADRILINLDINCNGSIDYNGK